MEIKTITKTIPVNNKYYIRIVWHNDSYNRDYRLCDIKEDSVIVSSYNRDSFLLKVNAKGIKLTNMQECLIASI